MLLFEAWRKKKGNCLWDCLTQLAYVNYYTMVCTYRTKRLCGQLMSALRLAASPSGSIELWARSSEPLNKHSTLESLEHVWVQLRLAIYDPADIVSQARLFTFTCWYWKQSVLWNRKSLACETNSEVTHIQSESWHTKHGRALEVHRGCGMTHAQIHYCPETRRTVPQKKKKRLGLAPSLAANCSTCQMHWWALSRLL